MSTRRIFVQRPIAEEFIARLTEKTRGLKTGDPKEHDTVIGPLITEQALDTVKQRVAQAVADGATILAGGEAVGPCFQATLLTGVAEGSEFAKEETFGPVAAVEVVDTPEEAVAKANRTSYGLSAGIITGDGERAFALAQQIDSGIVHINDQTVADEPQMPFGGVKDSGFGRFGGRAVVDEFTDLRWITVRPGTGHPFPF
jgi:aldehyde dehydrogenase (NAD+)